jgi:hypothetical protein
MPYALFCNEAKLSKAYPTEADVWKLARQSGLVVDAATEPDRPAPRPLLDNDYEIRSCRPDPGRSRQESGRRRARSRAGITPEFVRIGPANATIRPPRPRREVTFEHRSRRQWSRRQSYGVASTSDACSAASATQTFLRCSPRIAPVILSTFPTGHEASCTKAIS